MDKTNEELRREIYQMAFRHVEEKVEQRVPEHSRFQKTGCYLEDPEDELVCTLFVEPSSTKPGRNCVITMGCIIPETDALRFNFVFWGNKAEVLAWLRDPANLDEAEKIYSELRRRCKESD